MARVRRGTAGAWCSAGILAAGTAGAVGAAPSEIPLEVFAAGPQMAEPRISPAGDQLVYLTTVSGEALVVVRELRSGAVHPILQAHEGPYSITRCEFKTADRLLCHLEGVQRGTNGRPYPASRMVVVNPDGSHLRVLFRNAFFAAPESVARSQFQDRIVNWLPDDPRHVLIELGDEGSVFPSVYSLDVYGGDLKLVVPAHPPIMDWTADTRGVVRFGYGFRDDKGVYIARSGPDSPWRTLEEFKRFDHGRFDPLAIGPQPDQLFVLAPYEGRTAVWRMDLEGGANRDLLFSRPDVDVGGLLEWPTDRHVVGFVYETDRPHTHFIDPRAQAIDELLERSLPGEYHVVVDATHDGTKLVAVSFSDVVPARYDLLDTATGSLTLLGRESPALGEAQLAPLKPVVVPGPGGISIPGYLTLPRGAAAGRGLPAVVLPHGGPYARDHWGYEPLVQLMANRGYAVLQLNFRGSTGYGEQWRNAGHQAWGTVMHEDISAGARWLIAQGIADPARMCIVGWSYGGYAALVGVEKEPHLYRCAVSIAGVSDLTQMERDDERFYGGKDAAGDSMGTDKAQLEAESPLEHADRIQVPVLLIHGEDDYTVLVGQTRSMARALARHGVRNRVVLIPHGDHSLLRPEMRLTLYRELSTFLGANLGAPPAADANPAAGTISGAAATRRAR
jgi:dipeptidyl aminopeptidase/acylaminoacyl peptidase